MALPSLATLETFKQWPGVTVKADEEASAELVLQAASSRVRRRAGRTWVDADGDLTDVPDGLDLVVVAAAARFWSNPTARVMWMAGSEQEQYAGAAAGITLTSDELADIDAASGRGGLWVLSTTRAC